MSIELYHNTAQQMSKKLALNYSTSFSLGIKLLSKEYRSHIFNIYGFVRVADEIVDTFKTENAADMLAKFKQETYAAIDIKLSTNPVLHAFQISANKFNIDKNLIEPFFESMESDLYHKQYSTDSYKEYIYGSAEVVGLMCLKVFCNGDETNYNNLKKGAKSLGAAFQKINFLRDLKSDFEDRGRTYFPEIDFTRFSEIQKQQIIADIKEDCKIAREYIVKLPSGCKFGVYIAYLYFYKLLQKIENTNALEIMNKRIRISNTQKFRLLFSSYVTQKFIL